jgi:AraC-like DNA-binding protein
MNLERLRAALVRRFPRRPGVPRHFRRMLAAYSLLLAALVAGSSLLLMGFFTDRLEESIAESNRNLLEQIRIYGDTYLLERVNGLFYETFFNLSSDPNLEAFVGSRRTVEPFALLKLYERLSQVAVANGFIHSVLLWRASDDLLISSREGVTFRATARDGPLRRRSGELLRDRVLAADRFPVWVSPRENLAHLETTPIISYAQIVPLAPARREDACVVVVNIDAERFFRSLRAATTGDAAGEVMIVDDAGRFLAHSDRPTLLEGAPEPSLVQAVFSRPAGFAVLQSDGANRAVSWTASSLTSWRYVSSIPVGVLNRRLFVARQVSLVVMAVILLAGLLGVNLLSALFYRPVRSIIAHARRLVPGEESSDEFSFIDAVFDRLERRVGEMQDAVDRNRQVIEYQFILDLLGGVVCCEEDLASRLAVTGMRFPHPWFGVVAVEFEEAVYRGLHADQRVFIAQRAAALAAAAVPEGSVCRFASPAPRMLLAVVNTALPAQVPARLEGFVADLRRELGIGCNAAVSDFAANAYELGPLAEEARDLLKYGFVRGTGNVFSRDTAARWEVSGAAAAAGGPRSVELLLNAGRWEEAGAAVDATISRVAAGGSYAEAMNTAHAIVQAICRLIAERDPAHGELYRAMILEDFRRIHRLEDFTPWIARLLGFCAETTGDAASGQEQEFLRRIVAYILANVDRQLSLSVVADHFHVSQGHLSRLFSRGLGITFSDYLIERRFEKAAEQLLAEPRTPVSVIARRMGYFDLAYFSRLFRQRYGAPPVQYRKRHATG